MSRNPGADSHGLAATGAGERVAIMHHGLEKILGALLNGLLGLTLLWGCAHPPQTLQIQTAAQQERALSPRPLEYRHYWTAIRHLAFDAAREGWPGTEYRQFTQAVAWQVQGSGPDAERLFEKLARTAENTAVRRYALELLAKSLSSQGRWQDILDLPLTPRDQWGRMARIYRSRPATTYHFSSPQVFLRSTDCSTWGLPHVGVEINGHKACLLLDSGADRTLIASDVAQRCGIAPLSDQTFDYLAATGRSFEVRPGMAETLALGGLEIRNLPVQIADDQTMDHRKLGQKVDRLQGVIGWDVLCNLQLTITRTDGWIVIRKPHAVKPADPGHFWLGNPIVTLRSPSGVPLYFLLDTGASRTSLYPPILKKLGIEEVRKVRRKFWSFGGKKRVKSHLIPEFSAYLGDQRLVFHNIRTLPLFTSFVRLDGILGADLLRRGQVIMDPGNGHFEYFPGRQH